jgi:DNA-directed RNA polymerase specialized sigma24 family protein
MSGAAIQLQACEGVLPGAELLPEIEEADELRPTEENESLELAEDEGLELEEDEEEIEDFDPELWLYRHRTVGMLKRFLRYSIEVGRLPSLLGREFFRTRITSYRVSTFEDAVIFVHDVEQALEKLDEFEKELIAKVVMQEYSQDEAARLMGCGRRTVGRRFPETLDRLSEMFLRGGLLTPLPGQTWTAEKSCQEAKTNEIPLSDSEQGK